MFVFPGLLPNKRQKPNVNEHADACKDRREAWDSYERGKTDQATKLFEGRSGISQWDLWRSVLRIFRHRNVDFVIAPYTSWAQVFIFVDFASYVCLRCHLYHQSSFTFNDTTNPISTQSSDRQNYSFTLASIALSSPLTCTAPHPLSHTRPNGHSSMILASTRTNSWMLQFLLDSRILKLSPSPCTKPH